MSVKSNYLKMNREEFEMYLKELKQSLNCIHILNDKFFYNSTFEINNLVIELNKKIVQLDNLINSFSSFAQKQIIQSILIEEIETTNKIENINSTKHDIFKIINQVSNSKDKKIISISNAFKKIIRIWWN